MRKKFPHARNRTCLRKVRGRVVERDFAQPHRWAGAGYETPTAMTASNARAPLVLIVDDNADSRYVYQTYVAHLGFRVAAAIDGKEAAVLREVLRRGPDRPPEAGGAGRL